MVYKPTLSRRRALLSPDALERAMRSRNLSGRELAALTGTSNQTISQLRQGLRQSVAADVATAVEHSLRVKAGELFGPAVSLDRRAAACGSPRRARPPPHSPAGPSNQTGRPRHSRPATPAASDTWTASTRSAS